MQGFRDVPRFGHTQDISFLFSNNAQDPYRYALGTICIAGIISGIFFLWSLLLVLFIFMGPVKVGFLSGFHMRQPKSFIDDETDIHPFNLPRKVHSFFLINSSLVIVCSVLLVVQGIQPFLIQSRGIEYLGIAANGAKDADTIIQAFNQIETMSPVFINEILPSQFCSSANAPLSFDQTRNATIFQQSNFSTNFQVDSYYGLRDNVFMEVRLSMPFYPCHMQLCYSKFIRYILHSLYYSSLKC